MFEQRRHPRKVIELPVEIPLADGKVIRGVTRDISVGGAFLLVSEGLEFGLEIEIAIDLPDLGPTRLPAIVRWRRPEGFGVQFGLLGARQTHGLTELMAHTS